jgi:hypothetical protein
MFILRATVQSVIHRYENKIECVSNCSGQARQRKSTAIVNRIIEYKVGIDRHKSAWSMTSEIEKESDVSFRVRIRWVEEKEERTRNRWRNSRWTTERMLSGQSSPSSIYSSLMRRLTRRVRLQKHSIQKALWRQWCACRDMRLPHSFSFRETYNLSRALRIDFYIVRFSRRIWWSRERTGVSAW